MTVYIIIDKNSVACFKRAETYSEVIYAYAENVGIKIDLSIFQKALSALNIEESVSLFNDVCLSDSDRIEKLLSNYTTLYNDEKAGDME